jgi:glycine/D-amino acid oxidase-like deaminating enzyme
MRDLAAVSPWLAGVDEAAAPLEGDLSADVAIVGAGLTGLSAALALRREGMDVVVLEAERAGFGASGRNAGHVTPAIGKDLPTLVRLYGRERSQALVRLVDAAISHVEALIERHRIECDYQPVGNLIAAVHPSQHASLDRAAEAAAAFGLPGGILERDELERRGIPRFVTRGFFEPHGGVLDPGRYVRGLRRAALAAGAALFEGTPVIAIEDGAPVVLRTPRGRVRARFAVLATNAYTPELKRLSSCATRLHVQLFRTEPLDAAARDALRWAGGEGIYTAHEVLESWRWTADGRILGGSKVVRAGFGQRWLPDVDPGIADRLERTFRLRFPELRRVKVERHWGGPIFMSLDFLPWIGRRGNVLHALAFAGHGIPLGSLAGEILADLVCGRAGPWQALTSRRAVPTPPEPLRWLAFQAIHGWLSAIDRHVDARVDPAGRSLSSS